MHGGALLFHRIGRQVSLRTQFAHARRGAAHTDAAVADGQSPDRGDRQTAAAPAVGDGIEKSPGRAGRRFRISGPRWTRAAHVASGGGIHAALFLRSHVRRMRTGEGAFGLFACDPCHGAERQTGRVVGERGGRGGMARRGRPAGMDGRLRCRRTADPRRNLRPESDAHALPARSRKAGAPQGRFRRPDRSAARGVGRGRSFGSFGPETAKGLSNKS